MFTILVLAGTPDNLVALGARHPSVEILGARDPEDVLDKLARNRRIDAVLLLTGDAAAAALIQEEDPGAPPLFASASAGSIPGVGSLGTGKPEELLERLVALLAAQG